MKWKVKEDFIPNGPKYAVCKNITQIIEDMIGKKIKTAWEINNTYGDYNDAQNRAKYLNKTMEEKTKDKDIIDSATIIISFDKDHNLYIGSSEWLHFFSFKR